MEFFHIFGRITKWNSCSNKFYNRNCSIGQSKVPLLRMYSIAFPAGSPENGKP